MRHRLSLCRIFLLKNKNKNSGKYIGGNHHDRRNRRNHRNHHDRHGRHDHRNHHSLNQISGRIRLWHQSHIHIPHDY